MRARQKPTLPGGITQLRGQRTHWTRLSGNAFQNLAGFFIQTPNSFSHLGQRIMAQEATDFGQPLHAVILA
jgi:hypothetical protein